MQEDLAKAVEILRKHFPNGHPSYLELTLDELDLHSKKNDDYARGGDSLGNFRRAAHMFEQYPGLGLGLPEVQALVYAMKQLDASLWMLSQGYEGKVEDVDTRLRDVHNYAKLARLLHREGKSRVLAASGVIGGPE